MLCFWGRFYFARVNDTDFFGQYGVNLGGQNFIETCLVTLEQLVGQKTARRFFRTHRLVRDDKQRLGQAGGKCLHLRRNQIGRNGHQTLQQEQATRAGKLTFLCSM